MRTSTPASLFIVAAATMLAGCCGCKTPKSPGSSPVHYEKTADANTCTMQSAGVNVLKIKTPDRAKCTAKEGSLKIHSPHYDVEFWLVPDAKTVDEAIQTLPTQIVDEFKEFKATHTSDLTVANSPAKRLVGTGKEADDGDPGEADLIVFKIGSRIFIACDHGEGLTPVGQQGLLTLVQSAKAP